MKQYFLISLFIFSISFGQELDDNLTLEKKSLMILPASKDKYEKVADKIISIIAEQAAAIGRFEVID